MTGKTDSHREHYTKIINDILWDSVPPVDIVRIAYACGLKVYKVKDWKDKLSGMIKKDKEDGGESGYAIYTNSKHSDTRRRFTVAHEIAHFVLHTNLIGDGLVDDALYRSGLSSLLETEANRFAADILMPMRLVREATEKETSIIELAKKFNVSDQAMAVRLTVAQ